MPSSHTPGPWEAIVRKNPVTYEGNTFYVDHDIYEADPPADRDVIQVASVRTPFYDDPDLNPVTIEESRVNAALIAAAPEMLHALQNLENDGGQIPDHAWQIVQAAIAKAEGRDA